MIEQKKICSKCRTALSLNRFSKQLSKQDGLMPWCKDCVAKYYQVHKMNYKQASKKHYLKNIVELKKKHIAYNKAHRYELNSNWNNYYDRHYEKWKKDPLYIIEKNLRNRIRKALLGIDKSAKTMELLGCSIEELYQYLQRQFKSGMSWENYGKEWHIDHIRPCASFNLLLEEEQKMCFHYSNLQPLWKAENLEKGAKF